MAHRRAKQTKPGPRGVCCVLIGIFYLEHVKVIGSFAALFLNLGHNSKTALFIVWGPSLRLQDLHAISESVLIKGFYFVL